MMPSKLKFERIRVKTGALLLDIDNPRFGLKDVTEADQALSILVERANLKELWDSITSQGWLELEPMVCISADNLPGHYIVIEGNRRLAAITTLLDPSRLEKKLQGRVPIISPELRLQLEEIEIVLVPSRRDADAFIGFKHVNGPASWGSLAKAKFASDMFMRLIGERVSADSALKATTDALGDTTTSMLRMLMGFEVLQQSIELEFINSEQVEGKSFDFSHLYTMMPNPATRDFLGLGSDPLKADNVRKDPVPPEKHENLKYLMGWLFGGRDVPQVIKAQGTDRPTLQKVLAHKAATETLIKGGVLEHAAAKAGLDVDAWRSRLIKAESQAKSLLTDLSEVQSRLDEGQVLDAIDRSSSLKSTYNTILSSLKSFNED